MILHLNQIKKQLNRMVEVIKVMDLSNVPIHMKEILFAKIKKCSDGDKAECFGSRRPFMWKWRISEKTAYFWNVSSQIGESMN